ncbi:hypothetical protein [Parasphingopyxis sp.]|uniref:hypothetical protein n=1 Tax=Parasphingopyxis sp. TaxID=1920299 RepID=UPI00260B5249|nr:hypothetical protein [Parasphingopyxis sp.]
MSFLKTLFWIVLSAVVVLFSINNWLPVTVNLWGGLEADVKMPVLVLFFFLVGFLPTFAYYRTKAWRLSKRVDSLSRQLADERGMRTFRAPQRPGAEEPTAATDEPPASPEGELQLDTPLPSESKS